MCESAHKGHENLAGPNMIAGIEKLLNSEQTAEILGLHPKVVERMAKRGEVPGFKVGKFWRFKPSALEAWVRRKLESTGQPSRT
jgi:excisionase family DNA binding protein